MNFSGTPTNLTGGNPLDFYPITPCRVADTRVSTYPSGFGPPSFGAGETRTYNVLSSPCAAGIPSSVQAYSLNFTVVPPAGGPAGNLTTWPVGLPSMPVVSTLNYSNSVVANAAVVPAGTNGAINVVVNDPTNVLFDINGYFAPPGAASSGLEFFPVTPCRIADTRVSSFPSGFGPPSFGAGETRAYAIPLSLCGPGIPSSVAAYSLNFTVVPPSGGAPLANLTTWPVGLASMPNVSTLNFSSNVVANAAIVPAGTTGNEGIDVYVNDPTNVLFDINGYLCAAHVGLAFLPGHSLPGCGYPCAGRIHRSVRSAVFYRGTDPAIQHPLEFLRREDSVIGGRVLVKLHGSAAGRRTRREPDHLARGPGGHAERLHVKLLRQRRSERCYRTLRNQRSDQCLRESSDRCLIRHQWLLRALLCLSAVPYRSQDWPCGQSG